MTRRGAARRGEAPAPEARTLVIVSAASLGVGLMAFVLGMHYGLGQTSSEDAPAAAGESGLEAMDRQAAKLRAVRASRGSELSFHDTLSGPARPAKPVRAAAAAKKSAPKNKPNKPVSSPPSPELAVATAAQPDAKQKPTLTVVTASVPRAEVEPGDPEQAGAETLVAAADEADAEPDPDPDSFSLQVGAFPDANAAEALAGRLSEKGYLVRIASADVEGRGTWYRVRVGPFADREAAESQRSRFAQSEGLFALVVPER